MTNFEAWKNSLDIEWFVKNTDFLACSDCTLCPALRVCSVEGDINCEDAFRKWAQGEVGENERIWMHKIDYEYGIAWLYTPTIDWDGRFCELASQCFGIRKSIGQRKLITSQLTGRNSIIALAGGDIRAYEALMHGGDQIVWDRQGAKILSEFGIDETKQQEEGLDEKA